MDPMIRERNKALPSKSDVKRYVMYWNVRFPIDKWWRFKHKIPFGSERHLEASFIDMLFEYEEEAMYREYFKSLSEENSKGENVYEPGSGDIFRAESYEMTDDESQDLYDSIDIKALNEKHNGQDKQD